MTKVIKINETNSIVRVQAGILGPDLETRLRREGYTCSHFPQSFEFSTVGGWVAARGAGQTSTGHGKIENLVLSLKVVTPAGTITTKDYPAMAQGWDINQIFIGSEGVYGVITEVSLKIRKYMPKNTKLASFVFHDFVSAVNAMRDVMQSRYGSPFLFRLSDAEETDMSFKLKGAEGSWGDKYLKFRGYKPGQRCLVYASAEGDKDYANLVIKKVKRTAKKHGGLHLGKGPAEKWLEQRFSSAYLRDPLMDLGIMTDTLETAVKWENLIGLWSAVRGYIKSRAHTVCMVHISHVYETGANLYFVFLSPMLKGNELNDYKRFHKGLIDTIQNNNGSLSHHHGVGRALAPWMEKQIGKPSLDIMKALKDYLDPKKIMNPGGTLGLDS